MTLKGNEMQECLGREFEKILCYEGMWWRNLEEGNLQMPNALVIDLVLQKCVSIVQQL